MPIVSNLYSIGHPGHSQLGYVKIQKSIYPRRISSPEASSMPKSMQDVSTKNAVYADNALDIPEDWRNGPIGLQVTARRLEEEKVVDMLCKVKDALSK
jgi:hypothetical protein